MADAMVTARMSATKKEAGNRVLASLGSSASQAINELYDHLVEHKELPWKSDCDAAEPVSQDRLHNALAWVDGLNMDLSPEFANMSIADARRARLGLE